MKADQKISVRDSNGNDTGVTGTIVGIGHMVEDKLCRPFYTVKLDNYFSDPSGKITVSYITVDRKTLQSLL